MSSNKPHFLLACLLLGFTSIVAQIVFIREMLVVFGGNELCLGVLLFVWLLWVGVGSFVGNRVQVGQVTNDKEKATFANVACHRNIFSLKNLFLWYIIIAILCFLTIFFIRSSKLILGLNTMEIVGFIPMTISSFILLAPFCFLLGFVFVLNSKVWQFSDVSGFVVNRVYLWESIGAGLGGLLATFIFIPNFSNFNIIQIIVLLNLLLGIILLAKYVSKFKLAVTSFLFLVIIFVLVGYQSNLEKISLKFLWRDLPLVKTEDTKYGNIAILKNKEQISFYENGLLLFSYPAPFSSEEAIHFALSEHSNPQKLLLIGGGLGGGLAEALKYDKLKIDYVELDSRLIGLAKEYLPPKEADLFFNPKLNLHLIDGRLFVKNRIGKEKYDVIISNLPDPSTLQLNRFYTVEFFNSIKEILNDNGIFSFRVSSAENYISHEQGLYLSSLYRSLSLVFKKAIVLPGENNIFIASDQESLFYDWSKITTRLNERSIRTVYINQNFLPFRLSQFRIDYLKDAINKSLGRINYDLEPISFFYNIILWSAQFKSIDKPTFLFLYQLNRWWVFFVLIGIWLIFLFYSLLRKEKSISLLALSAIFITGATSIFLEMVILLSFQVFYGYLYSKVGLILALFMFGLGIGALYMQNRIKRKDVSFGSLALMQLYQLFLVFVLVCLITYFSISSIGGYLVELVLYLSISSCGIIGGMEFVLANHLYLREKREERVGKGYSVDLWGSAISSILASVILIPILGVITVMIIFLLANFVLFLALIFRTGLKIS
jgi:spermidine synthase